ncbi:hypothetical protein FSP39_019215, partial [Pinctada imbricata]
KFCQSYQVMRFNRNVRSWDDARSRCQRLGMDLIKIDNMEEDLFIQTLLKNNPGRRNQEGWWIGGINRGNGWRWTDGSQMDYQSFPPGNTRSYSGTTNYAAIFKNRGFSTSFEWGYLTSRSSNKMGVILTARLREKWFQSQPKPAALGNSLSTERLPLHVIRQRLRQRSEVDRDPQRNWRSADDIRRREIDRQEFRRKWIHEVLKKDEGYQTRLPYVRDVAPPSMPPRQYTWCSHKDTRAFFYLSNTKRPHSDYEKDRRSRHIVHPEWNSETISWARLHSAGVRDIHKISLFG